MTSSRDTGDNVPKENILRVCRTCCLPDTKPDLYFDDTGQCSACRSVTRKHLEIDWVARRNDFIRLLDRHNGEVIVPSSGGKDSTYQALKLKEMGAHVTAVTARTCHLTPVGRKNIDNLSRHVRTIEVVPNMTVRAALNRLGLEMVGDISWPEHAAIFTTPFRVAADLGIKLIMYGECPQAEYGGPQGSDQARQMTRRWVTEFGGFLGLRPSDFVGMAGITARDMVDYTLPGGLENEGIEAHFLGAYEPWDSRKNASVAIESGMQTMPDGLPPGSNAWWAWENLDNAQTAIHDHAMYLKYGFGRFASQISVDVRHGRIGLEDARELVKRHDHILPDVYAGVPLDHVLSNIGMTRREMMNCLMRFAGDHMRNE